MSAPGDAIVFVVSEDESGQRLDKWLATRLPGLGRRRAAEMFRTGAVTIRGRATNKGAPARAGDEVRVVMPPSEHAEPEPDAPLVVALERDDLVVVRKPAGQPTAPLRGERGTLVGALLGRFPEMAGVGHQAREPGILHRLDTQTSGLIVAARTSVVFEHMRNALASGQLKKRYYAVVAARGLPAEGLIDDPIAPHPRDDRRVMVGRTRNESRSTAPTSWRKIRATEQWALLEVEVSRAMRHQIRAHLASIGHPIAGDTLYGGEASSVLQSRHALHASYVAWAGDEVVLGFEVEDRVPEEFLALLAA